jgi:sulfotransferase 6B1
MRSAGITKSALYRKSKTVLNRFPRAIRRAVAKPEDYLRNPPILCNSFPKSGTHLLLQVLHSLPGIRSYGAFLASMPTVPFRRVSHTAMSKRITKLTPGELAGAHLFCDENHADLLQNLNVVHYFIFRDPRDVVVSEAHYLARMNRWHRMHRYFAALPSFDQQLTLAIEGVNGDCPYEYPDVATRFKEYAGWLQRGKVLAVRFEDFMGKSRAETVLKIVRYHSSRASESYSVKQIVLDAMQAIKPKQSHTFREGRVGGWREVFTVQHKKAFKDVAGQLLFEMGYETTSDW